MKVKKIVHESQFSNQYGGLSLVEGEDGEAYLEMDDCYGPLYFGPLTARQVVAYGVLCKAKMVVIQ